MLYKLKHIYSIYLSLIFFSKISSSYQEYALIGTNLKNLYEKPIMSNTIERFWHDANVVCKMDTTQLIHIYDKLLKRSDVYIDQFEVLLRHHIKKRIIYELNNKLVEAFYAQSMKIHFHTRDNIKELHYFDKRLALHILDNVLNKVFIFLDQEILIHKLMQLELDEIHMPTIQKILNNYKANKGNTKILPIITFYIISLFKNKNKLCISCNELISIYNRLPIELRLLYQSHDKTIVLVNQAHLGYLPLLEASEKYFRVFFTYNEEGFVVFGKQYGDYMKYLGSKEDDVVFSSKNWDSSLNQLWQVIWPEYLFRWNTRGLVMFQNRVTKMLLCANKNQFGLLVKDPRSTRYENYFIQLSAEENMLNNYCYWMFKDE